MEKKSRDVAFTSVRVKPKYFVGFPAKVPKKSGIFLLFLFRPYPAKEKNQEKTERLDLSVIHGRDCIAIAISDFFQKE